MTNIKGDFHFHSLHSACQIKHQIGSAIDYSNTCGTCAVTEMIEVAKINKEQGYQYITIANHANNPAQAKPATKKETVMLLDHIRQITELNQKQKNTIHIFAGVEVDILNQKGQLSVPDSILKQLDIVIASNHRPTKSLNKNNIKEGFIKAIKNKNVDIIGHLTRFISNLDTKDWQDIINLAKQHQKIIEFNINAPLSENVLKLVAKSKAIVSIGSDTHLETFDKNIDSIENYVKSNIKKATAAIKHLQENGISKRRIINTFELDKIKQLFKLN